MSERYAVIISALFDEEVSSVPVTSVITYQDGRQATLETTLAIREVRENLVRV